MPLLILFFIFAQPQNKTSTQFYMPIDVNQQLSGDAIQLSDIGQFGLLRAERPNIPAHYHTGIDIKRPSDNYNDELIYPITKGKVISKRTDGPYAQLIIEHDIENRKFWTLYEHIAGIRVSVNDSIFPMEPIARFMNKEELDKYGWQFDHFHFEVLKVKPMPLKTNRETPERYYNSYTLICFTKQDLNMYFYDPVKFLTKNIR